MTLTPPSWVQFSMCAFMVTKLMTLALLVSCFTTWALGRLYNPCINAYLPLSEVMRSRFLWMRLKFSWLFLLYVPLVNLCLASCFTGPKSYWIAFWQSWIYKRYINVKIYLSLSYCKACIQWVNKKVLSSQHKYTVFNCIFNTLQ